ncbi:MAG: FtsX-like permease family protein [Thermoleophilia bacterium]|nr:FtsX-like permease family protein [Thermoleophilia bacterium]
MLKLAWRGVRHNRGRYIATLIAILTGVAFFTATGFVSDRVIDTLEGDATREYGAVDLAVIVDDTDEQASGATVSTGHAEQARIAGPVADRILAVDEVEAGAGILTGRVAFLAADGSTFGDSATGRLWVEDDELNPISLSEGRAPAAAGEIAVDTGLADGEDLTVGQTVTVLSLAGQAEATIVGITEFGNSDALDQGGTVSIPAATAFDWLSNGQVEYESLYLRGPGDQAALAAAVEPLVPDGFRAQTGDDFLADRREETGSIGRVLKNALQAFSILALLVGAFVIYNTFSVIVAQRLREIAVLSAIGATPKQIRRSLRWEGVVVGLLGSLLGVVTGIGLAFLVMVVLEAVGVALPGGGIAVRPATVVSGILIGTIITVASVMIPARRASRTEPIEALRDAAVESTRPSRGRIIASVALLVLGVLGLLFGGNAFVVGMGAFLLFVGVIVAGPLIAIGGTRLMRPLMSRFGLEGRLAVDNTARNPKRTATTANALLIGVFLVTLVTVAGTSAKDFAVGEIKKLESADYLIQSDGGSLDDAFVSDLESVDGVQQVSSFRQESVTIDGTASLLSTVDVAAVQEIADIDVTEGSFDDLRPGTIAVTEDAGRALGDTVTVANNTGRSERLTVVAIVKDSIDSILVGSIVGVEDFDTLVGDTAPTVAFIDVESGGQSDTTDAIEEKTSLRPDITLTEGNALGRLVGQIFDFVINAVNGLLMMSVIIALIGIVNTLSLSILERRKELGLLRVVGMTDRKVQRMVRLESVLIAGLGTVTGLIAGTFVGWALIRTIDRLSEASIGISIPIGQLALILVAGVVLGLLAALIPARRSTRLEVLDAIKAT